MTDAEIIRIDSISKSFGEKLALSKISFNVPKGQLSGLLGPNGAGKTTFFRLVMGLLKPTVGAITIDGFDSFAERASVMRIVGFLPDEPIFYTYMSGREILELSAAMRGLNPDEELERISPIAARLGLSDDLTRFADEYSRGTKKKLGLLLAMMHRPKFLLLDEPTNGLDVESTHIFYDLMREEASRGTTVLFSTHLMDQVARLCSHVTIFNQGELVTSAPLSDLRLAFINAKSLEDIFLQLTSRSQK